MKLWGVWPGCVLARSRQLEGHSDQSGGLPTLRKERGNCLLTDSYWHPHTMSWASVVERKAI